MWMVRSGNRGVRASRFIEEGVVAIGWDNLGINLKDLPDRSAVIDAVRRHWPDWPDGRIINAATQLFKFSHIIKIGDQVATYESESRKYYLGEIVGDYEYNPNADAGFTNTRKTKWAEEPVSRDDLSQATRNSLGSTLTIFEIRETIKQELELIQQGTSPQAVETDEEIRIEITEHEFNFDSMEIRAKELIKDRIMTFSWDEMQEFVAALLRAMDFKTQISSIGPDLGKDIVASPDGLGLSTPRVFVEVKHRPNSKMDVKEVRAFLNVRNENGSCLYVSTGGFTKEAYYEAERSKIPTTLMNIDDLVEATIDYYEKMDYEGRVMLRLGKIFWPLD